MLLRASRLAVEQSRRLSLGCVGKAGGEAGLGGSRTCMAVLLKSGMNLNKRSAGGWIYPWIRGSVTVRVE